MSATPSTLLFLHPSAELYGADRTLLQLVEGLDRRRWRAVVALPHRGPLAEALERAGATVEVGELGVGARGDLGPRGLLALAWRVPRGARFVLRLVRRHRPVLVHTNTMVVLGGALGARLSGARHLWHVHEILERPRWLARLYSRLLAWLADEVVSNSEATRARFDRWHAPLRAKHSVVLNGVDDSRLDPAGAYPAGVRAELGVEADAPLVLLAGRINPGKGQGVLVEAAALLRDRHPRARFALVGDAPPGQPGFERDLDMHIRRAGLGDIVFRAPFRTDVASLYAAADVCVVSSTRPESFGLVAAEAMALSKPVVASNHSGLAEVVVDGETGRLVTPGDPGALAAALDELLSDPARAAAMGAAGRRRQRARFTVERYVADFARRYEAYDPRPTPPLLPPATRVVHLVFGKANPDRVNGVNRVVHQLACAQVRADRAVEVWGLTPTPAAPAGPRPYRLRCFRRGPWRFGIDRALAQAIEEAAGPVVFHLHGGLLPELAISARRISRAGHAYSFTPHGAYRQAALARRPLLKRLTIAIFDRGLVASARAVQAFNEQEAIEVARVAGAWHTVVIPNGQDLLEVPPPARLGMDRPIFGFLGRLAAYTKGLDVLIDGFARFAEDHPGSLVLVGEGRDRDLLEARARALGVEDRVAFLGARFGEHKLSTVVAFDAFVHPSRHDAQPGAVLEAAALGVPLLITEGTGLAREVTRAGAGLVLGQCAVEPLAEALRAVAEAEADARQRWSDGARRLIAERPSWGRIEAVLARELYGIADIGQSSVTERVQRRAPPTSPPHEEPVIR